MSVLPDEGDIRIRNDDVFNYLVELSKCPGSEAQEEKEIVRLAQHAASIYTAFSAAGQMNLPLSFGAFTEGFLHGSKDDTCHVAVMADGLLQKIVVVFKANGMKMDAVKCSRPTSIPCLPDSPSPSVLVHSGCLDSMLSIFPRVIESVNKLATLYKIDPAHPVNRLCVCGHGYGASQALLFALHALQHETASAFRLSYVGLGCPRVGGPALSNYLAHLHATDRLACKFIEHPSDPTVHLPVNSPHATLFSLLHPRSTTLQTHADRFFFYENPRENRYVIRRRILPESAVGDGSRYAYATSDNVKFVWPTELTTEHDFSTRETLDGDLDRCRRRIAQRTANPLHVLSYGLRHGLILAAVVVLIVFGPIMAGAVAATRSRIVEQFEPDTGEYINEANYYRLMNRARGLEISIGVVYALASIVLLLSYLAIFTRRLGTVFEPFRSTAYLQDLIGLAPRQDESGCQQDVESAGVSRASSVTTSTTTMAAVGGVKTKLGLCRTWTAAQVVRTYRGLMHLDKDVEPLLLHILADESTTTTQRSLIQASLLDLEPHPADKVAYHLCLNDCFGKAPGIGKNYFFNYAHPLSGLTFIVLFVIMPSALIDVGLQRNPAILPDSISSQFVSTASLRLPPSKVRLLDFYDLMSINEIPTGVTAHSLRNMTFDKVLDKSKVEFDYFTLTSYEYSTDYANTVGPQPLALKSNGGYTMTFTLRWGSDPDGVYNVAKTQALFYCGDTAGGAESSPQDVADFAILQTVDRSVLMSTRSFVVMNGNTSMRIQVPDKLNWYTAVIRLSTQPGLKSVFRYYNAFTRALIFEHDLSPLVAARPFTRDFDQGLCSFGTVPASFLQTYPADLDKPSFAFAHLRQFILFDKPLDDRTLSRVTKTVIALPWTGTINAGPLLVDHVRSPSRILTGLAVSQNEFGLPKIAADYFRSQVAKYTYDPDLLNGVQFVLDAASNLPYFTGTKNRVVPASPTANYLRFDAPSVYLGPRSAVALKDPARAAYVSSDFLFVSKLRFRPPTPATVATPVREATLLSCGLYTYEGNTQLPHTVLTLSVSSLDKLSMTYTFCDTTNETFTGDANFFRFREAESWDKFAVCRNATSSDNVGRVEFASPFPLVDGAWHTIAVRFQSTRQVNVSTHSVSFTIDTSNNASMAVPLTTVTATVPNTGLEWTLRPSRCFLGRPYLLDSIRTSAGASTYLPFDVRFAELHRFDGLTYPTPGAGTKHLSDIVDFIRDVKTAE